MCQPLYSTKLRGFPCGANVYHGGAEPRPDLGGGPGPTRTILPVPSAFSRAVIRSAAVILLWNIPDDSFSGQGLISAVTT
jgi:hypothetical protein